MGCPTTPLSCLEPANIFAGLYKPACAGFADPSKFQAERTVYSSGFSELINNYGVDIDYYVHTYNLSSANNFYGEHTVAPYYGPVTIRAYVQYTMNGVPLQVYGWEPDDTITMYIHVKGFEAAFAGNTIHQINGQRVEPKADDGMVLTPFGCDRPGGRDAKRFVITEAIDEDSTTINPLAGHYVWKITAKRFDYSFEAGFEGEDDNVQVYENSFSGVLSSSITLLDQLSTTQLSSWPKSYPMDVDEIVKEKVFDNSVNDTSIYGDYF
jgi:hypothetical protein